MRKKVDYEFLEKRLLGIRKGDGLCKYLRLDNSDLELFKHPYVSLGMVMEQDGEEFIIVKVEGVQIIEVCVIPVSEYEKLTKVCK